MPDGPRAGSRPQTIAEIVTPALVLDRVVLERNLARMARFFSIGSCRVRPHFKAHKTPEIARRQLAAGSCSGLTCATVGEAETVAAFCDDVLIANEVVSAAKCARIAALAARARITVAVDSVTGLEALAAAARHAGVRIGALVDVNVGQGRCGVAPGADALQLARRVALTSGVALRGVMGYEGHVQPIRDRAERDASARQSMAALLDTAARLRANGLGCEVVSAGGTGTYDISGRIDGVTEIQAGSYALMDTDYAAVQLPFEQAFWVIGTIVSRPAADRCIADCGHKATTKDHGLPSVAGFDGATVVSLNDEHATLSVPPESRVAIGDLVRLVPSHTDPTINLHDAFYVIEGDRVVDVWAIARGYPEQRASLEKPSDMTAPYAL